MQTTLDTFTANLDFVVFNETGLKAQTRSLDLTRQYLTGSFSHCDALSTLSNAAPSGWTRDHAAMISFAYPQAWQSQKISR